MSKFDRLSSLINHFSLKVTPLQNAQVNFIIMQDIKAGEPTRILLAPLGFLPKPYSADESVMFSARKDWGGHDNPLFATLPTLIERYIDRNSDLSMLVRLLKTEYEAQRCGVGGVLNRLGEVLMIRIIRQQIELGPTPPGLLNGLADSRLSRAVVSMYQTPEKRWTNVDLAEIAGLSLSRFTELFNQRVGQTVQSYLRHWRMILACQDIERGDRIQTVATRYGYGSSEALSRAFQRQFGVNSTAYRNKFAKTSLVPKVKLNI
jgi:AraC-like DNA-binding protein